LPDILGVIDQSMRAGKVGGYGVSNHSASQLRELIATASSMAIARPILVQAEYSLLNRAIEDELLPLIGQQGIAFAPFFPLAGGLLTGKYSAARPVAGAFGDLRFWNSGIRPAAAPFGPVDEVQSPSSARVCPEY
jgi:aryl-alcohol dehydrogenase-like predicted oxidoreductase